MQIAKATLIKYFKILQYDTKQVDSDLSQESKRLILKQFLNNFYMFLEEFTERPLNFRAGIKPEHVVAIKIKNEYGLFSCVLSFIPIDLLNILHNIFKLYCDIMNINKI